MQYPEFIHEAKAKLNVDTEQEVLVDVKWGTHTTTHYPFYINHSLVYTFVVVVQSTLPLRTPR